LAANLWNADLLVLLSDINGLYDKDPKSNGDARLIEEIHGTDRLLDEIDVRGTSSFGTGGIVTKIEAARKVNSYGIPMILLNGKKMDIMLDAMREKETGTVFLGK
jgi:glutamate 5-kinase